MVCLLLVLGFICLAAAHPVLEFKAGDFDSFLLNEEDAWFLGFVNKACDNCEAELQKFANSTSEIKVISINYDEGVELRKLFEVKKAQTFFFIKQKMIREYTGAISAEDFADFVTDKYLNATVFDNVGNLKERLAKKEALPVLNSIVITKDNVTSLTTGSWLVLVFAPWCGHCKALHPTWNELVDSKEFKEANIRVASIDGDANSALASRFGVTGYPTILFFKESLVYRHNGTRDLKTLTEFALTKYQSISGVSFPYFGPSFVEIFDARNFTKLYSDEWFVLMHAPWCGLCRRMQPIWEDFSVAEDFKQENVKLAKIDVSEDSSLQFLFSVSAFPTIYRFSHGDAYVYEGEDRTANGLRTFALNTYKTANKTNPLTGPTSFVKRFMSAYIYYVILSVDFAKSKGISQYVFVVIVLTGAFSILGFLFWLSWPLLQTNKTKPNKSTETKEEDSKNGESKKTK